MRTHQRSSLVREGSQRHHETKHAEGASHARGPCCPEPQLSLHTVKLNKALDHSSHLAANSREGKQGELASPLLFLCTRTHTAHSARAHPGRLPCHVCGPQQCCVHLLQCRPLPHADTAVRAAHPQVAHHTGQGARAHGVARQHPTIAKRNRCANHPKTRGSHPWHIQRANRRKHQTSSQRAHLVRGREVRNRWGEVRGVPGSPGGALSVANALTNASRPHPPGDSSTNAQGAQTDEGANQRASAASAHQAQRVGASLPPCAHARIHSSNRSNRTCGRASAAPHRVRSRRAHHAAAVAGNDDDEEARLQIIDPMATNLGSGHRLVHAGNPGAEVSQSSRTGRQWYRAPGQAGGWRPGMARH